MGYWFFEKVFARTATNISMQEKNNYQYYLVKIIHTINNWSSLWKLLKLWYPTKLEHLSTVPLFWVAWEDLVYLLGDAVIEEFY